MPKKGLIVLLAGMIAGFTLACSCQPLYSVLEYLISQEPVYVPPTPVPPASDLAGPASCEAWLANLLPQAENTDVPGTELSMEYTLVTYAVSGNAISVFDRPAVPDSVESLQADTALQHEIWDLIVDIVPAEYRDGVGYFLVFTDGPAGTLGAVEQTDDPATWTLEIDQQDAGNFSDLTTTLIHEISHIFTLDQNQVATDYAVFNAPDDQSAYEQGDAACDTYFLFEGCSTPDSYINLFFDQFWQDIYPEWQEINLELDEDRLDNLMIDFYGRYADRFVSDYAVTSPEEDIAETFMYFVLAPQPAGDSIAEQKMLFFYQFSDLMDLREHMRSHLCAYAEP
jgi:hypothetical protein